MEFERIVNDFLGLTRYQLRQKLRDSKATALELMIGRMVRAGTMSGDTKRIEFLLNRMVGRSRQVPPPADDPQKPLLSFAELAERAAQIKKKNEDGGPS